MAERRTTSAQPLAWIARAADQSSSCRHTSTTHVSAPTEGAYRVTGSGQDCLNQGAATAGKDCAAAACTSAALPLSGCDSVQHMLVDVAAALQGVWRQG
jgi:hypothetical protein